MICGIAHPTRRKIYEYLRVDICVLDDPLHKLHKGADFRRSLLARGIEREEWETFSWPIREQIDECATLEQTLGAYWWNLANAHAGHARRKHRGGV